MSTMALICAEGPKGRVRGIYCHSDGNPSSVGRTLEKFYAAAKAVEALIDLGNISSLGERLADEEGGERDALGFRKDTTVAYCRDLRRPLRRFYDGDRTAFDATQSWDFDFVYLFANGKWLCRDGGFDEPFMTVEEAVAKYERH